MRERSPFPAKLTGLLTSAAIRCWMETLEYKCRYYDRSADPVNREFDGPKIYVFWHEYILFPLYLRGNCNLTMLLSQHRDADALTHIARHLGFDYVRGSTFRGGISALRALQRKGRSMNLTMTPDGPRGPRRQMEQGAVYLASRLQLPLVLLGFGYDRPWRLNSWDRFAIPRPGSRARAIFSSPINIPKRLDRDGIEHYRQHMEACLNRLTMEAESWAESQQRVPGECPMRREGAYWTACSDTTQTSPVEANPLDEAKKLQLQMNPSKRLVA